MKTNLVLSLLIFIFLFLIFLPLAQSQTIIPAGNVSGTWAKAGSPYQIQGTIQIPNGQTLSIDPGVIVEFQGHYQLNVQGRLLAIGTAVDTISFSAADTTTGWWGIRFVNTPSTNDTSKIKYCKFRYGKANGGNPDCWGGALFFYLFNKCKISDCTIRNCTSISWGGGICCIASGIIITNNTIFNNISSTSGGGIYVGDSATISSNIIFNNFASSSGGGIEISGNSLVTNNTISNNTSNSNGGGGIEIGGNSLVTNNTISNNTSNSNGGGGILCISGSPIIRNNTISNNTAIGVTPYGGGIGCLFASSIISGNIISNNSSLFGGGIGCYNSSSIISSNTISNNTASNGGGICYQSNNGGDIFNNTISNNNASSDGGGISCISASPTISNTSIVNNSSDRGGALYCENNSNPTFRNCILYNNTSNTNGAQVFLYDEPSDPNFHYCDVHGDKAAFGLNGNSYTGTYQNNIDADPKFVAPSGGAGTGFDGVSADWSLQSSSPCIDKGDPSGTYSATDKAGNPRVRICRIDMGAYEYQSGNPLSASITQTQQILCRGDASAVLTANALGGAVSDTYSYAWSNGSTTSSVTGLLAGVHSATVSTTVSQCQVVASYTVSEPSQMIISPSHKNDNACNAINDGIASVNIIGGQGPYTYLWVNNNTSNSISGLAPGNYSVTVSDNNGCIASNIITIGSISTTITPNFSIKPDTCIGGVGKITTSPSGGLGAYTFTWSTGSSAQNIFGLSSGNYTVNIADSLGCAVTNTTTVGVYTKTITTTFTSVSANCHKPNGSITANPSGGTSPYSYVWSNGISAQTMNNIFAGNYTVNITDKNGCTATKSSLVTTSPSIATPQICMVTVDSLSKYNVIVWDKKPFAGTAVKSFIIYRDTANNNYAPIGKTPFDSLSQFIDTVRTLYSANGDPNFSSWRYKIAMEDSCGNLSSMSLYHQSLFIINNGSSFVWTDYKIEGQSVPILALSSYLFQRDDFSTGNYVTIATLSASSNLSTDPQYSTFQNTANWRVQTQWSISCTPTRAIKTTKSNTIKKTIGGITENEFDRMVNVYPNPSSGRFTINSLEKISSIDVIDLLGETVFHKTSNNNKQESLNLDEPRGIYFLHIKTQKGTAIKKIIIE